MFGNNINFMTDTQFPLAALPPAAISSIFSNFDSSQCKHEGVLMLIGQFLDCILDNPGLKTEAACCESDDVETVTKFMCDKCHPSHCANLDKVLCFHASRNHVECVKMLLDDNRDRRAKPNADDHIALFRAAQNGHTDVVKLLLDDNREHCALPANRSLVEAAANGFTDVVKLLLNDNRAQYNGIPLILAATAGHTDVVRLLLHENMKHRAALSATLSLALTCAAKYGHTDAVKILIGL